MTKLADCGEVAGETNHYKVAGIGGGPFDGDSGDFDKSLDGAHTRVRLVRAIYFFLYFNIIFILKY